MKEILFYIVIFVANVIHGITGFAGTLLAMPFGTMIMGSAVARPVLNVLGIIAGLYVFVGDWRAVQKKELGKIALIMTLGMIGGIEFRYLLEGKEKITYLILGIFVIAIAIQGLYKMRKDVKKEVSQEIIQEQKTSIVGDVAILILAGIAHGMFVCGGAILIGYLTKKIHDKKSFRATISTVWIILNSIMFASDLTKGCYDANLTRIQLMSIPFLLAGMFVGSKIYKKMSQRTFMFITYVLLIVSGLSLLVK